MDNKVMFEILSALSAETGRSSKVNKIQREYGKDYYYSILGKLFNEGYMYDNSCSGGNPIDIVADGSSMFNLTASLKITDKGKSFLENYS